jgi:hypothetical protein
MRTEPARTRQGHKNSRHIARRERQVDARHGAVLIRLSRPPRALRAVTSLGRGIDSSTPLARCVIGQARAARGRQRRCRDGYARPPTPAGCVRYVQRRPYCRNRRRRWPRKSSNHFVGVCAEAGGVGQLVVRGRPVTAAACQTVMALRTNRATVGHRRGYRIAVDEKATPPRPSGLLPPAKPPATRAQLRLATPLSSTVVRAVAKPTDAVGLAATRLGQPGNVADLVVTRRLPS